MSGEPTQGEGVERCEPCSYFGDDQPALYRQEFGDTPVCRWHSANPYSARRPGHLRGEGGGMSEAGVALHEIAKQRAKGWPDFHPETYCHRCGRRNVKSWFVDSDEWRQAFPDDAVQAIDGQAYSTAEKAFNGIVCPPCFTEVHERETGNWHTWELRRAAPTPKAEDG